MNIDDIRNFLENELLLKKLKLDAQVPSNLKINKPILKQILNKYNWLRNANEIFYLLKNKNNLKNLHIFCPTCRKKNKFETQVFGYANHCSTRCSSLDPNVQKKSSDSSMKKWGYSHPSQSPIVKKKHEDTNLKRIGAISPLCLPKIHSKGVKIAATPEIRQKVKIRKQERYNDAGYHNFEQAKETYYKRTGYRTTFSNPEVREKSKQKFQEKYKKNSYVETDEFQELNRDPIYIKIRTEKQYKTKEKNGTLPGNPISVAKFKESMSKKTEEDWKIIAKKQQDTKIKNGTTSGSIKVRKKVYETNKLRGNYGNRSKSEKRCFAKVKEKFQNAEHSYYDEKRYPFNCDIYIPNLDLFIECHFGEFHYKEPFDKNNLKHIERLNILKENEQRLLKEGNKNTRYTGMIRTWTITDPLKLKTFQDNHLNYKIFYTEKEFNEWFDSL